MKKFILLVSTLLLSLFLVNNKVYAQSAQDPVGVPIYLRVVRFEGLEKIQDNVNTSEYYVYYAAPVSIYEPTTETDYFLINYINVVFRKGLNRNTNSYELASKVVEPSRTRITLRVTVLKTLISENYPTGVLPLFAQDSHLYVKFSDPTSEEYTRGYNDGYNTGYNQGYSIGSNEGYENGYNTGYDEGYTDGVKVTESEAYQRGYNDGSKKSFQANLHTWIVPAIIVVVIAGIFVGYRRERYHD